MLHNSPNPHTGSHATHTPAHSHPWVTMPPHMTAFSLLHNSHVLTHSTTHEQLPYPMHQDTSPRPHMSHTCHHKPTPMPTPLTWPAARGTLRNPCHLSFPRGASRSQEREPQPFSNLLGASLPGRAPASQPSPNTYLFM